MNREKINIYFDKKYASVIYLVLLFISVYFLTLLWSGGNSVFLTFGGTILCLLFTVISLLGIFTLFSKRFHYYGPDTSQYKNKPDDPDIFLIFPDRIQVRVSPGKVIYYHDVSSLIAIPNCFIDDWGKADEYFFFLEIKDKKGQKMLLSGEKFEFLNKFNQSTGLDIKNFLFERDINKQYGKLRVILASFLFDASPLRVILWAADK